MDGLKAARACGNKGGQPKGLSKEALAKVRSAILYNSGERAVPENASSLGINRATCYRYITQKHIKAIATASALSHYYLKKLLNTNSWFSHFYTFQNSMPPQ